MNLYGVDYSLFDLGYNDPSLVESLSSSRQMIIDRIDREREEENLLRLSNSLLKNVKKRDNNSPEKHRHDGTSPLPLGMDWSPPPRNWNGPNTIWPQDSNKGWRYCVTVPSWSIFSESGGAEPIAFYRVQVGLQSPEGVTTMREVLRRFSNFVKLSSDLKLSFRGKKLPPVPPKGLLRTKSRSLLEERRHSLEDWLAKVLSDIDFSRSAPVACFLELEAAVRSSFSESSLPDPNVKLSFNSSSSSDPSSSHLDVSVLAGASALASEFSKDFTNDKSEVEPALDLKDSTVNHTKGLLKESLQEDKGSTTPSEISELSEVRGETSNSSKCSASLVASQAVDTLNSSVMQYLQDLVVVLPTEEQQKMKKLLTTMQVEDLESEAESTKMNGKVNLDQVIAVERERFSLMQRDIEELRGKCTEMEFNLKTAKDEKAHAEATKISIIQENVSLRQELSSAKEELMNLQKCTEEADFKEKPDVELLVREIESLRNSQSELRQELDRVTKERTEFETRLRKEMEKKEHINVANAKLLHECEILRNRLKEGGVDFMVDEENKLKMDASPSDALDILATSENHISLLLAEAQMSPAPVPQIPQKPERVQMPMQAHLSTSTPSHPPPVQEQLMPSPVRAPVKEQKVGRVGTVKQPKPRAKDPNKREMNMEEKQKLGHGLQSLPQEKMPQLVQIIRKRNEHLAQDGDEIELDIEALDTETLWELDRFVRNWKKMVSKTKRQALMMGGESGEPGVGNAAASLPVAEAESG